MEFEPAEEREIRNRMVLVPGEYDFEVADAKDTVSKNNNEMIALELRVFPHDGGSPRIVRDWLLPSMELKLNRFCHATGLVDDYFAGSVTAFSCEGRSGRLKLTIDSSEKYGDQNRVKDYIPPSGATEEEIQEETPEVVGVPAAQTRRANKAAKSKAEEYVEELQSKDDDLPF